MTVMEVVSGVSVVAGSHHRDDVSGGEAVAEERDDIAPPEPSETPR